MKRVMMISTGIADEKDMVKLDESPNFRKATLNMKLAFLALQQALQPFESLKESFKKDMSLFLGTSHGEFNTTLDFLKSWAQQKLARPFVFQNSLHNSTTGFLGLAEGYKAPLVTSSHHYFSGEDALDLASQFIKTGTARVATVIGVDARAGDHLPHMRGAGFPTAEWGQGSGCLILASDDYCAEKNLKPLGELLDIAMKPALDRPVYVEQPHFNLREFYDSKAVESLAIAVTGNGPQSLIIEKPNGGRSTITWTSV